MASIIHEMIVGFLHEHLILLFNQTYSPSRKDRVKIYTNLKKRGGDKEYQHSVKTPDMGLLMRNQDDTRNDLKWTLEVGVSQTYPDLQADARLWLVGHPTCSMVVLINVTESPKYRCPLAVDLDLCDKLEIPRVVSQITEGDFSLDGEYGPVTHKGYQWVGEISEVFLEVWTLDPQGKEPMRREQGGGRMFLIPPTDASPQLELADFLFPDQPQKTSFDWDKFRQDLKACLRSQAVERCREWLIESMDAKKLAGNPAGNRAGTRAGTRAGVVGDES
ncbi:uncharacterized protein PV07_08654 [Cladophialophora immunda]|uniref:Uncharacterized protein n=1 Tax=Cladophialophora immunda TaxID=569365 RepID=A0A0D2C2N8_9EURO|nr:uncharacterized protein PV07_08654 [Cladophialophora immunda]KIW25488.1 hypothetical protein PV07_08654 [Cladophialophora immunda]